MHTFVHAIRACIRAGSNYNYLYTINYNYKCTTSMIITITDVLYGSPYRNAHIKTAYAKMEHAIKHN